MNAQMEISKTPQEIGKFWDKEAERLGYPETIREFAIKFLQNAQTRYGSYMWNNPQLMGDLMEQLMQESPGNPEDYA